MFIFVYILFDKFQFWGLLQIVFCIVLSKELVNDMTRFGKTTPVWQMLKSTVQLGEFERSFCSKLRRKKERMQFFFNSNQMKFWVLSLKQSWKICAQQKFATFDHSHRSHWLKHHAIHSCTFIISYLGWSLFLLLKCFNYFNTIMVVNNL